MSGHDVSAFRSFRSWSSAGEGSAPTWPEPLAEPALRGLAGDVARTIGPHTEADEAALLFQYLAAYGNAVGRAPHLIVEATRHGTNLDVVTVGATAKARKGTSWAHVQRVVDAADPGWAHDRIVHGLSSGEGLIWAVRDPITKTETKRNGKAVSGHEEVVIDPGVPDKRLLVVEAEFASALKVLKREGNTLSPILRCAWDGIRLSALTKNSPARASDAHVSLIGHITRWELCRHLDEDSAANGLGNRLLFVCVDRSKLLPHGGAVPQGELAELVAGTKRTLDFGRTAGCLAMDGAAREYWASVYPALSEAKPGLLGSITARAEAQTIRLALITALLDLSRVITRSHLETACALWRYCEDSARYIFGELLGDPIADRINAALKQAGERGLTRTKIRDLFVRNQSAAQIEAALRRLHEAGIAHRQKNNTAGQGRPAEVWMATTTTETIETTERRVPTR
jgi:hypothetical protein